MKQTFIGGNMSRTSMMTWGVLLLLVGIQLKLVESYVLTRQATEVWNKSQTGGTFYEAVPEDYLATSGGYFRGSQSLNRTSGMKPAQNNYSYSTPNAYRNSARVPTYQASYATPTVAGQNSGEQRMITPPSWFCWPPIFLGSVMFLYGATNKE